MATSEIPGPVFNGPPPNLVLEESIIPFRGTVVSTKDQNGEPTVAERLLFYEELGLNLSAGIEEIAAAITDQDSYDRGAEQLLKGRQFVDETDEFLEPIRSLTYAMYQTILTRKKSIQGDKASGLGVLGKLPLLTSALVGFEKQKKVEADIQQQRDAAAQKQIEQDQNLNAAIAAEEAGMDEKSVEQIMTQPSSTPTPAAKPAFQRVAGVSRRENWAAEVTDFHTLVKAAAKNSSLLPLLEPNMPALNAQAKSLKNSMNTSGCIPGVRAVDKGSMAVRR